jgi:hypothetical protein
MNQWEPCASNRHPYSCADQGGANSSNCLWSEGGDSFFWLFSAVEVLIDDIYCMSVNGRFLLMVLCDKIFDELANTT